MPDNLAQAAMAKEIVDLRAEIAALKAYVMGFKGDGSGVEFRGNVASFRPPTPKNEMATGSGPFPQLIDGVCIGGSEFDVTFAIYQKTPA